MLHSLFVLHRCERFNLSLWVFYSARSLRAFDQPTRPFGFFIVVPQSRSACHCPVFRIHGRHPWIHSLLYPLILSIMIQILYLLDMAVNKKPSELVGYGGWDLLDLLCSYGLSEHTLCMSIKLAHKFTLGATDAPGAHVWICIIV